MLEEYEKKPSTMNIDLIIPQANSDIPNTQTQSEYDLPADELEEEIDNGIERLEEAIEVKKKEYDENYNKAETVSLMTKYQMIFVKIEVYLVNLASIFHTRTYPDIKQAFELIKARATQNRENRARKVVYHVETIKNVLSKLHHIVEKKRLNKTQTGFLKVKNQAQDMKLAQDMERLRKMRIEQLKNLYEKKRKEFTIVQDKYKESYNSVLKSKQSNTLIETLLTTLDAKGNTDANEMAQIKHKIEHERKMNKQLKLDIKATEEKSLEFISEINQFLDMHQEFFNNNNQYAYVLNDFLTNHH